MGCGISKSEEATSNIKSTYPAEKPSPDAAKPTPKLRKLTMPTKNSSRPPLTSLSPLKVVGFDRELFLTASEDDRQKMAREFCDTRGRRETSSDGRDGYREGAGGKGIRRERDRVLI
jgi:hypothetical protein